MKIQKIKLWGFKKYALIKNLIKNVKYIKQMIEVLNINLFKVLINYRCYFSDFKSLYNTAINSDSLLSTISNDNFEWFDFFLSELYYYMFYL